MPCVRDPRRRVSLVEVARLCAGLTRAELARRTGIDLARLTELETVEHSAATSNEARLVAFATEMLPGFFRGGFVEIGGAMLCGPGVVDTARCRCGDLALFLCDGAYLVGTCDEPLCEVHATEVGPDRHLCRRCGGA